MNHFNRQDSLYQISYSIGRYKLQTFITFRVAFKMKYFILLLISLWEITLSSSMNETLENSNSIQTVSNCMNDFSMNFYQKLINNQGGNLISSPLSAGILISMTAYGAQKNTQKQIFTALKIPDDGTFDRREFQSLVHILNSVKKIELRVASNIFIASEFTVKPNYIDLLQDTFDSKPQSLDFTKTDEASKTINDWTAEKTNNRINDIIQPDDLQDAKLVLLNAIYFKGKWENKFDLSRTKAKPFYVKKNAVKDKPMMNRVARFRYIEDPILHAKLIELPYERDPESPQNYVSMIVVVPNDVDGLENLENKFKMTHIELLNKENFASKIDLSLPKFTVESLIDLKSTFEKMGMTDMFNSNANFQEIVDNVPLKVSKIVQKAFIQVDEEGTEAAAATAVMIALKSYVEPKKVTVDRPFMFMIVMKYNSKTIVLFQGRVVDP